jgi:sulfonate transport system permease protein
MVPSFESFSLVGNYRVVTGQTLFLGRAVMLPAAAPTLINGLRLGLANGWLFLVAAELIASSKGLGFLLIDSQNTGRTDVMLLAIVLLAVLGKLSDTAFGAFEYRMVQRGA